MRMEVGYMEEPDGLGSALGNCRRHRAKVPQLETIFAVAFLLPGLW